MIQSLSRSILAVLMVFAVNAAYAATSGTPLVLIEVVQGPDNLLGAHVLFRGKAPAAEVVDNLVRQAITVAQSADPGHDVLASAFVNDVQLEDHAYSGPMIYVAKEHKVESFAAYQGVKQTGAASAGYYVRTTESEDWTDPKVHNLGLEVVFKPGTSLPDVQSGLIGAIRSAAPRRMHINAQAFFGESTSPAGWKQVKGSNGEFMALEFDPKSGNITDDDKVVANIK